MNFDYYDLKVLEKILLGEGNFNDEQKEFIKLNESKTIVAGPGSGKTTALAAKIALLLEELNRGKNGDGLCIITHTNVAVNEINNVLKTANIAPIKHPHFIGTIHEFFNKYCVMPYFKFKHKNNNVMIDKKHKTDIEFYKKYLERNVPYMKKKKDIRDAVAKRIVESNLFFNINENKIDLENTSNWKMDSFERHRDNMLNAKLERKAYGFLTHDDTFLFSKAFLNENRFIKMLRKRFKYIFLDEFQDTSPDGALLLEKLFGSNSSVFFKVGDPYQTIGFNQSMPIIKKEDEFRLNISNRFGREIADHLNIIQPSANISTSPNRKSFPPVLLIYDKEEQIYESFKKIILEYEDLNQIFKNSAKQDKVLVRLKSWSSKVKGTSYIEKDYNSTRSKNINIKTLVENFVVKKVAELENKKLEEMTNWIENHQSIQLLHHIYIEIIKNELNEENKEKLSSKLDEIFFERGITNVNYITLFIDIKKMLKSTVILETDLEASPDDIFTIHSVKGETLRAVLLVDFDSNPFTEILKRSYKDNIQNVSVSVDDNLFYVSMSRVTHLFVFAIRKEDWEDKLIEHLKGWTVYKAY